MGFSSTTIDTREKKREKKRVTFWAVVAQEPHSHTHDLILMQHLFSLLLCVFIFRRKGTNSIHIHHLQDSDLFLKQKQKLFYVSLYFFFSFIYISFILIVTFFLKENDDTLYWCICCPKKSPFVILNEYFFFLFILNP